VHKAQRSRVVIVSPSLLMLSIQVIQALLKDARMREQAHLIQGEVIRLMEDCPGSMTGYASCRRISRWRKRTSS
jgi:DNA anti-recombination protein RmuC